MNDDFKNLYEVQKTITFELKSKYIDYFYKNGQCVENKNCFINFEKTSKFMEKNYFSTSQNKGNFDCVLKFLETTDKIVRFADNFATNFSNGNILARGFEVKKKLLEKYDRISFFELKKRKQITVKRKNVNTGKTYDHFLYFSDRMNLENLFEMTNDQHGINFCQYLEKILNRIKLYRAKMENNLTVNNDNEFTFNKNKVVFCSDAKIYFEEFKTLLDIFSLIERDKKVGIYTIDNEVNETNKIIEVFEFINNKYSITLKSNLGSIIEVVNKEAKKPIILTSLNPRVVNKDSKKTESEFQNIQEFEKEIEIEEMEMDAINIKKFEYVELLEKKLKNSLDELKVLKTDIQSLINKKRRNEKLLSNEIALWKEFQFAKTILKYIKLNGVVISNKKNGRGEYQDVFNYRKSGERLNNPKNLLGIGQHPLFHLFKEEYDNYKNLCGEKFRKAKSLGDKKSLYNAVSREVLRQKEMQYLSFLAKDSYFYYLVLIDKDFNKDRKVIDQIGGCTGNWQMLDYYQLTFKALEKLALLGESTFDINNQDITKEVKLIWQNYKEKKFKEYRLCREEKQGLNRFEIDNKKESLQKNELNKLIDFIKKVINKLPDSKKYNFQFKSTEQYKNLDEFKKEIDEQGYFSEWISIDKEKLLQLEKETQKEVLIFKLHNKDFRKVAIDEKRKQNLFTEYWLDAMRLEKEVRITPEIDIFKKNKEEGNVPEKRVLETSQKEVISSARIYQNKLYGAFRLKFYPNRSCSFEKVNEKIKFKDNVCFLGMDRGEKSLISWCLIDNTGKLIKNGDWTKFDDEKNSDKKANYAEKLKIYKEIKECILQDYERIAECIGSEEKQKLIDEVKKKEKELEAKSLLATETIKQGYCGHLIKEINKVLLDYPNTYIVLEDLDIQGKSESRESDITNKMDNLAKTMGATIYQTIENALVNKFKYYSVKTDLEKYDGQQLVPNIVKVEDLRICDKENREYGKQKFIKSKDKIGNILFIDEYLTSNECPNCGFNHEKIKNLNFNFQESDQNYILENNGEKYLFSKDWFKEERVKNVLYDKKIKQIFFPRAVKNPFIKSSKSKKDFFYCSKCQFSSENNLVNLGLINGNYQIKTGDDLAAYIIAKRGLTLILNKKKEI